MDDKEYKAHNMLKLYRMASGVELANQEVNETLSPEIIRRELSTDRDIYNNFPAIMAVKQWFNESDVDTLLSYLDRQKATLTTVKTRELLKHLVNLTKRLEKTFLRVCEKPPETFDLPDLFFLSNLSSKLLFQPLPIKTTYECLKQLGKLKNDTDLETMFG